jgi:hypothetical protein
MNKDHFKCSVNIVRSTNVAEGRWLDTPGTNLTQRRGFRNAFALHCNLTKSTAAETSRFDSRKGQETFLEKSRPALRLAHHRSERVPGALPGSKVKPTTELNLQPRLKRVEITLHFPTCPRGVHRDFTFYHFTGIQVCLQSTQIEFYQNSKMYFTLFAKCIVIQLYNYTLYNIHQRNAHFLN